MIKEKNIGFAITGSYCTFTKAFEQMEKLVDNGANVIPIFSNNSSKTDTRFGKAKEFKELATKLTGNAIVDTIVGAEPIGPKDLLDIVLVAPCTGNTLAKIANAITDTSVTMAVKAQLRNLKPVVLAISTNDGLGANATNIGKVLNRSNVYLVPFSQDNSKLKQNSLVAHYDKIVETLELAIEGKQIQPVIM